MWLTWATIHGVLMILSFQIQIARVIHQVYKAKLSEIALMTPYRAQKDCVKQLANVAGLDGLTVATITESQGAFY